MQFVLFLEKKEQIDEVIERKKTQLESDIYSENYTTTMQHFTRIKQHKINCENTISTTIPGLRLSLKTL